jgi:hypothetical protein
MEKVWAILERYIEWIAITIGGLLFMYALWAFWIRPDVTVELGNDTVGPRNVDTAVRRGPGASLEAAINSPFVRVTQTLPDLPQEFADELAMTGYVPRPMQVPGLFVGANPMGRPDGGIPEDFRVTQAPVPPPARVHRVGTGRSFADVPVNGQVSPQDLAEVRVDFEIPAFAIAQAFREVRLPQVHQNTAILRVQLLRQRLMPDGSWGEEQTAALLQNNPLASMQLPDEQAPADVKLAYSSFAEANPQWVREPPFYEVRAGDDPMALEVFIDVTPEGELVPATQPATTGPRTSPNHQDDPRAGAAAENTGNAPQGQRPPSGDQTNQPAQGAAGPGPAARGVFNAVQHQGAIRGWAWDVNANPGETYRYRVTYALRNPMFGTKGIAAADKPELQSTLSLFSLAEQTTWSPPITVEPLTYFFMTGASSAQAKFTVFRWQNGKWQSQDFDALAGDPIGVTDPEGIDFGTGRTLVDVRIDPGTNETYALLVDSEGRFTRRSVKDTALPKLKELEDEVKAGAGVAAK